MNDFEEAIAMVGASEMGAPVFKRASSGATQIWRVEREGGSFRTIHGQLGGAQITSEWTVCEGKNAGKKNETTPQQQAILEVIALYKKKTAQGKYSYELTEIDTHTYLSPMLAQPFTAKKMTYPCNLQPKLDGVRCIVDRHGMWSRKGKPFPACMHIHESLKPVFALFPDLILDGELYNHDLKEDFEELMSIIRQGKPTAEDLAKAKANIYFHVYDCPNAKGEWLSRDRYVQNLLGVEEAPIYNGQFSYASCFAGVYIVDFWSDLQSEAVVLDRTAKCVEHGYEGAMVKLNGMEYETKRTYQIQKVKDFIDEEFEVLDIREGKGNWTGHAKIADLWLPTADRSKGPIFGDDPRVASGEEIVSAFSAGIKGSKAYAKTLLEKKAEVIGKPATLTFFRYTNANKVPYLPIFKVIRDYE